jgi:hypothetical protein
VHEQSELTAVDARAVGVDVKTSRKRTWASKTPTAGSVATVDVDLAAPPARKKRAVSAPPRKNAGPRGAKKKATVHDAAAADAVATPAGEDAVADGTAVRVPLLRPGKRPTFSLYMRGLV